MSQSNDPALGINSWLEDELYHQYQFDRKSVDEGWSELFQHPSQNGGTQASQQAAPEAASVAVAEPPAEPVAAPVAEAPPAAKTQSPPESPSKAVAPAPKVPAKQEAVTAGPGDQLVPLRGASARIAENMVASLAIPVATSQRQIPTRVIEENRNLINKQRALQGRGKLSFTHIIAWAIVKAVKSNPTLNHAFDEKDGQPFRVVRSQLNLGLAVDVPGKDGSRSLLVPNIKNADSMNFAQFVQAYDEIVAKARNGKLQVSDFQGTTLSLTNPGTVGTLGSVPRLMPGQGAIIATGAMDFPAEFAGTTEETRAMLGLSKVLMVTCTYDHRIIQGAESGSFLAKLSQLLL
ncbi:MAG TPA: 2-oxo acid dehydrogenase subunit E2, partial [Bryobacteraceae bacterium]